MYFCHLTKSRSLNDTVYPKDSVLKHLELFIYHRTKENDKITLPSLSV